MTDHDRGAYTPQTDQQPLSFDPRMPRKRRPFPVTLVLSVLILLGLILALVFIYRSGVRGEGDAPQPVGEPVGAVREAASPEAQPADPAAGLDVYTADAAPAAPVFTAPPEAPAARPATSVPVITPPAATTPAPPVAAPTPSRPVPTQAPSPIRATPAPTTPPAAAPAASGGASAQIGAYNTREQAQAALSARAGGRATRIEPVERNGTTLYRAMVIFPDRAAAQAFCPSGCIIR